MSSSEDEQLLDNEDVADEEVDSAEEDDSDAGEGSASEEESEEEEEGDSEDGADNGDVKGKAMSKTDDADSESEEDKENSVDEDEDEEASGSGSDESDDEKSVPQAARPKKGNKAASNTNPSPSAASDENSEDKDEAPDNWEGLGLVAPLCEATRRLGWNAPTEIQRASLVHALAGRDIIGLAETGSGKTGAFALPILQALLAAPQRLFAVCLAPTRELAFQIHESFEGLGSGIGLSSCCVVGGVDMVTQAIALAKRPHVVIGTPGRLVDHIENTKGFSLRTVSVPTDSGVSCIKALQNWLN